MQWLMPLCLIVAGAASGPPAAPIEVDHALVTLIEQVEVPAREAGVLAAVEVREGQLVAAGDQLAHLDDTQPQLAKKRAEIEFDIARTEAENNVDVRFARKIEPKLRAPS